MERQVRTAFLAGGELARHSKVSKQLAPPNWRGNYGAQPLDTLSLRTLRGFQRIEALRRGLYITLHMRGKIAPSKDPFGGWISVELAIFALRVLHNIPTPFALLNNGMTGPSVEAAARLFHKETIHTRFDRHTFHRFALPFSV
jgi:hypothetical protein